MKKLYVLMIILVMTLCITACGGGDKNEVTEAFNSTNTENNVVVTIANENLDKLDQVTMDAITKIINAMEA